MAARRGAGDGAGAGGIVALSLSLSVVRYARYAAWAVLLLLLAQMALVLAREPCVGVADNLDYWRVAKPAGIDVPAQRRQGYYVVCSYPEIESGLGSFFSSPALMAWLARPLGWGLPVAAGQFDLRQVGLLYWALTAGVLAGALLLGAPPLAVLLLSWVIADPGFLLFFNSLYADPALLLGLLGTACFLPLGWGESSRASRWALAALVLCAALAGFSKMQYSLFPALLLGACAAALLLQRERPDHVRIAVLALLGVVAVAGPAHFFWGDAPRFLDANAYNAVYGGIARVSSDPAAALAALGIPEEHRLRPTKDYFAAQVGPDDPVLPYLRRLSRLRLAGLYLRDPTAAWLTAARIAEELWQPETNPRGNYTREESGRRRRVYREPFQFSLWRSRCLGWLPAWTVWLFLAGVLAALIYRGARNRWQAEDTLWLLLLLWVTSQAAVAVLGEGLVNLQQHLVGARLGFDLLLVLVLARLWIRPESRHNPPP